MEYSSSLPPSQALVWFPPFLTGALNNRGHGNLLCCWPSPPPPDFQSVRFVSNKRSFESRSFYLQSLFFFKVLLNSRLALLLQSNTVTFGGGHLGESCCPWTTCIQFLVRIQFYHLSTMSQIAANFTLSRVNGTHWDCFLCAWHQLFTCTFGLCFLIVLGCYEPIQIN